MEWSSFFYVVFDCTLISCFNRFDLHPLFLLSPCLPGPTGRFIRAVFCTSLLFILAHICFLTVLYTYPPLTIAIGDNCSQWDTITRHIGVSRYVTSHDNMLSLMVEGVIWGKGVDKNMSVNPDNSLLWCKFDAHIPYFK